MKPKKSLLYSLLLVLCIMFTACSGETADAPALTDVEALSVESIPPFSGEPYIVLNDNQPDFSSSELTTESFEIYSELDQLGRCGVASANIGVDLMPTEKRGSIGQVKPTGWHTVKYDSVDGKYLYNRCHLIGYQLTAENANEKNLITGTRYMNTEGMLPFENMVADYIKETKNHVLYRVTPIFEGSNLVASGVKMEAMSVEDKGAGIEYNVFVYNNQPGIEIDYANGESWLGNRSPSNQTIQSETAQSKATQSETAQNETTYVLNKNTHKFHLSSCSSVNSLKESNKEVYQGSREDIISQGYEPCGNCRP